MCARGAVPPLPVPPQAVRFNCSTDSTVPCPPGLLQKLALQNVVYGSSLPLPVEFAFTAPGVATISTTALGNLPASGDLKYAVVDVSVCPVSLPAACCRLPAACCPLPLPLPPKQAT